MTPAPTITAAQLNEKQRAASDYVDAGGNLLVTGPAGTGKSVLLNLLRTKFPDMPVTASTGIAALNVNGCTIHSWASLGTGDKPAAAIAKSLNERRTNVWYAMKKAKRLAIDEVSMVDADLIDKLDEVLRLVRQSDAPFGGVQMIFFGDFLQLPPVVKDGNPVRFAFESRAWQRADVRVCLLTQVMRQRDEMFANTLSRVRVGDTSEEVRAVLRPRINAEDPTPHITPVTLATHNEIADSINVAKLAEIKSPEISWESDDWADGDFSRQNLERNCIALKTLALKVGAQVMLLQNIDQASGLVNGSLGEVIDIKKGIFRGHAPVVKFLNGVVREIDPGTWEIKRNTETLASRRQLPLRLSYAISIHKSQGMSLDKVRVHLARCFADGQAYVAMSRARTLEGLFIADIKGNSIRANHVALEFYRNSAAITTKREDVAA